MPVGEALRREQLFSVHDKVALVTGGSSGIGRMIAAGLVDAGARVVISSRKRAACDDVAAALSRRGDCRSIPADLGTTAGCEDLARQLADTTDRLDIVVNNAGATWGAPLEEFDDHAWDRVLDLNVKAVFTLTRLLVPLLTRSSAPGAPSRIVNIGSRDGLRPPKRETYSYSASKAAVHHLTRHLAWRLAPAITVNAVAPGPFPSRMMAKTLEHESADLIESAPMKRLGQPSDIAGTVIFLCSPASAFMTGSVLPLDGGLSTCA